jgi:hypothetical protein
MSGSDLACQFLKFAYVCYVFLGYSSNMNQTCWLFLKIIAQIVSGEFVWFRTTFTSPVIASQPLADWLVTHGKLVYGSQGIDFIYRCNNYGIPLNCPMVGEYKKYHISTIHSQLYISIIIPLKNHIQTDRIYPNTLFVRTSTGRIPSIQSMDLSPQMIATSPWGH